MQTRSGPEAIEAAVRGTMKRAPEGATGIYITPAGIAYGYHTIRDRAPTNYVFFEDAPAPTPPRYTEPISAWRKTDDERILLEMNPRQANVLYRLTGRIAGEFTGPRGVFTSIRNALASEQVRADRPIDKSLVIGDGNGGIANNFYLSSDNHDA